MTTPDLCDAHADVRVAAPVFRAYGGRDLFGGRIATVRCPEDNSKVRAVLATPGEGRVLVVDGGGSLRCALLGDQLASLAVANGWSGLVINGCVRDVQAIATMDLGVQALAAHPRKSEKRDLGEVGIVVAFAGVQFHPGDWLYADANGIVVAERRLAPA